jgi:hypothetical protein
MQISESALSTSGMGLKINMRLSKTPNSASDPIKNRRMIRYMRLSLVLRILEVESMRENGPEKRMIEIMRVTTRAKDSTALLSDTSWG